MSKSDEKPDTVLFLLALVGIAFVSMAAALAVLMLTIMACEALGWNCLP